MEAPDKLSRPKFSNAQTILYEIDMLTFAAASVTKKPDESSSGEKPNELTSWRDLECFLLHFRNLIEFFGRPPNRSGDLSVKKKEAIWPVPATRPSDDTLKGLYQENLWKKYEDKTQDRPERDKMATISRYLQHCTEQRVEPKSWNVGEMFNELKPLMSEFENLLPDKSRPWSKPPSTYAMVFPGHLSYSTATPRIMPVASIGLNLGPLKKNKSE
jgi:hypothetical protein